MCGIYGFISTSYERSDDDLVSMKNSLRHRGPDHYDYFADSYLDYKINLGHVRLSIIDVSSNGNQPMTSKSERYTIVYNGEVYNFKDIRAQLEIDNPQVQWRGSSDTEVILECIEHYGLEGCLTKMVGMFAFALWDKSEKTLVIARDRIGEKPLYYGLQGNMFFFASELVAIEAHSKFERKLNNESAVGFLTRGYIPNNCSIYEDIKKVQPGTYLKFDLKLRLDENNGKLFKYWAIEDVVKNSEGNQYKGTYEQAQIELEQLLISSVKDQTISDVPLGAFLSGGIDSSLICAILKKHVLKSELLTFTIAMPAPGSNEAPHAARVAHNIGTTHTSLELATSEIVTRIDEILSSWDEPFADSSQIPTFFVSELARKSVTVTLSGDGADEFVYGYPDYLLYSKYSKYVPILRYGLADFFMILSKSFIGKLLPRISRVNNFFYLLKLIENNNLGATLLNWKNKYRGSKLPIQSHLLKFSGKFLSYKGPQFDYVGYYDVKDYLPNDILVKVDRAAMAVSLESRAPFLDHRVLEFLMRLPLEYKFDTQTLVTKRILKDILYKYVPKEIVDRPKQGFSIPLTYWLRHDLKGWAFAIIDAIPTNSDFWDKDEVLSLYHDHISLVNDNTERLWNVIVLELFFKRKKLLHHV